MIRAFLGSELSRTSAFLVFVFLTYDFCVWRTIVQSIILVYKIRQNHTGRQVWIQDKVSSECSTYRVFLVLTIAVTKVMKVYTDWPRLVCPAWWRPGQIETATHCPSWMNKGYDSHSSANQHQNTSTSRHLYWKCVHILCFCSSHNLFTIFWSPWYDFHGWLGVKKPIIYPSIIFCCHHIGCHNLLMTLPPPVPQSTATITNETTGRANVQSIHIESGRKKLFLFSFWLSRDLENGSRSS